MGISGVTNNPSSFNYDKMDKLKSIKAILLDPQKSSTDIRTYIEDKNIKINHRESEDLVDFCEKHSIPLNRITHSFDASFFENETNVIRCLIKLKRSAKNFNDFLLKAKQVNHPYTTPSNSTQSLTSLTTTETDRSTPTDFRQSPIQPINNDAFISLSQVPQLDPPPHRMSPQSTTHINCFEIPQSNPRCRLELD